MASWYFLAICPALLYNRSLWAVILQLLQWVTCWRRKAHGAFVLFYHNNSSSWLGISVKLQANKLVFGGVPGSVCVCVCSVYAVRAVQSSSAGWLIAEQFWLPAGHRHKNTGTAGSQCTIHKAFKEEKPTKTKCFSPDREPFLSVKINKQKNISITLCIQLGGNKMESSNLNVVKFQAHLLICVR